MHPDRVAHLRVCSTAPGACTPRCRDARGRGDSGGGELIRIDAATGHLTATPLTDGLGSAPGPLFHLDGCTPRRVIHRCDALAPRSGARNRSSAGTTLWSWSPRRSARRSSSTAPYRAVLYSPSSATAHGAPVRRNLGTPRSPATIICALPAIAWHSTFPEHGVGDLLDVAHSTRCGHLGRQPSTRVEHPPDPLLTEARGRVRGGGDDPRTRPRLELIGTRRSGLAPTTCSRWLRRAPDRLRPGRPILRRRQRRGAEEPRRRSGRGPPVDRRPRCGRRLQPAITGTAELVGNPTPGLLRPGWGWSNRNVNREFESARACASGCWVLASSGFDSARAVTSTFLLSAEDWPPRRDLPDAPPLLLAPST